MELPVPRTDGSRMWSNTMALSSNTICRTEFLTKLAWFAPSAKVEKRGERTDLDRL